MKLSNRKSYMTALPEGEAPKSPKPKVTQLIYILSLLAVFAYIVILFVERFYYFTEVGVVEVEKITISSARGGRISSLNLTEGEQIKKSSTIAIINNRQDCKLEEDTRVERLMHEIAADRVLLNSLNTQIKNNTKNSSISNKTDDDLFRALELERALLVKTNTVKDISLALSVEANLLRSQLQLKKNRLKQLQALDNDITLAEKCYDETIVSPFDATVYSIQKQSYEVITRSESILTLVADNSPVRIEVFLEMEDFSSVIIGDILELEFPGKLLSEGEVESIHSSAYDSPDRKWEQYKPVEPHVRLHLKPTNEKQTLIWKSFDQMEVKVRGRK